MPQDVSRNGSSGTASIKGLVHFYILQIGSKLHVSLLLLQFPNAAEYISAQSTKQSNEVIYSILCSLYVKLTTGLAVSLWIMERVTQNLCFHPDRSHSSHKMWNLRTNSEESVLNLVLAFLLDLPFFSFVIFWFQTARQTERITVGVLLHGCRGLATTLDKLA